MNPLNPTNIALHGTHLIEASAGTGKTYTITGLYLRLILERRLAVENILVVTFTEAACLELKDKIRERLILAHRICGDKLGQRSKAETPDNFIEELLGKYTTQGLSLHKIQDRLALALMDFDLATVYTIHGFCLRVLQDSAFESSFPFDLEFIESDTDLLQQVIDDYWRHKQHSWPSILIDYLCRQQWTPDTLIKILPPLLGAARTAGLESLRWPPTTQITHCPINLTEHFLELWQNERKTILAALQSPVLRQTAKTYKANNVSTWATQLNNYSLSESKGVCPLEAVEAFCQTTLIKETKPSKKGQTPEHEFFRQCDQLLDILQPLAFGVLQDLLNHCLTALPELKRRSGLISFDDLLSGVHDGLSCKTGTDKLLATRVGRQYPVALIDEFQDTDAIQYDIFKRIFHNNTNTLFMIGDPKQAIYSFRGADIFSYLEAATAETTSHTLTTNWRSEPDLTLAVNYLFDRHQNPFVLPQIKFQPVNSPPDFQDQLVIEQEDDAPLSILYFPEQKNRDSARRQVATWTANRIKNMLGLAEDGSCRIENLLGHTRPLSFGDIAVLVRSHNEGEMVRRALQDVGLSAIIQSRQTVYQSPEARDLELILNAVCRVGNDKALRAALCTRLLGITAHDFLTIEDNDELWGSMLIHFTEYRRIWQERGPAPMLHSLFQREGVYLRISSLNGADRQLTNIRHLMELLQTANHEQGLGPEELLGWLRVRRHDEGAAESGQIRLESDEDLIKIVTVHKSKGLQYPVVFCPFFWDSRPFIAKQQMAITCHEHNRLVVDLSGKNTERQQQQDKELFSEELRLLYVAITRAKHRCYLFWGRVKAKNGWATATSALQYLLQGQAFDQGDLLSALRADFANVHEDFLVTSGLNDASAYKIGLAPAAIATPSNIGLATKTELRPAREFKREFNHCLGVTSFSALHRSTATPKIETLDDHQNNIAGILDSQTTDDDSGYDIFSFPRGAQSGNCLHAIFEEWNFQKAAVDQERLIQDKLTIFDIDLTWFETACQLLDNTMNTPLNQEGDLCLSLIKPDDRLAEMEFYYPVPAIDSTRLASMFHKGHPLDLRQNRQKQHGFMKGFIDLIFCWQDRYYIVDYKSNFLGDNLDDYHHKCLPHAMQQAGYDLQYAIYTEALHRYLNQRLPDYDFKRHFGGVYYLFLRGMRPTAGNNYGVYWNS